MKLVLSHCKNPHMGGYWTAMDRPKKKTVYADTFKQASTLCREYIKKYELGNGNWNGGQIIDDAGQQIAYVSYNGRVWKGIDKGESVKEEITV